ncbi:hypothetical protein ACFSQ7_27215 [Paenibacillus rhizoplanae]
MEYERTGRGLRLIETEDYRIQVTIPAQHELPFGAEYPVIYEAVNKSGKPLSLQISGKSNAQIRLELEAAQDIESEARIEGCFFIYPVKEEQNLYQTHPVVEAELLINGLPAVFKLGIKPKFPVKVKLQVPDRTLFAGEEVELDVTVENEYSTDTVFSFELPEDEILSFSQKALHRRGSGQEPANRHRSGPAARVRDLAPYSEHPQCRRRRRFSYTGTGAEPGLHRSRDGLRRPDRQGLDYQQWPLFRRSEQNEPLAYFFSRTENI